jgi:hypothetical protein
VKFTETVRAGDPRDSLAFAHYFDEQLKNTNCAHVTAAVVSWWWWPPVVCGVLYLRFQMRGRATKFIRVLCLFNTINDVV